MKVGDLVEVRTKFYGTKIGTIIEEADNGRWYGPGYRSWVVHIPNHRTSGTIAAEVDLKLVAR